jgi:hypothetical protein
MARTDHRIGEKTESHGPLGQGVMPRRAYGREGVPPTMGACHRGEDRSHRTEGGVPARGIDDRVLVQPTPAPARRLLQMRQVGRWVYQENRISWRYLGTRDLKAAVLCQPSEQSLETHR